LLVLYGLPPDEAIAHGAGAGVGRAADLAAALGDRLATMDPIDATALVGSLDRDVAAAVVATWGAATAPWLAASNRRPPTALRAQGVAPEALAVELLGEGIATTSGRWASAALLVEGRANLEGSAAYRAGRFEIQDEGSQIVAEAVDARGLVVDFCAGAGGKTLALAQTPGVERVVACDVRASALEELARRAARAPGVRPQAVVLPDAGPLPEPVAALVGQADRVLVDAPCSGTGVLRRHPAYRLRLDAAELTRLAALQGRILDRAAPLVKAGGWLVYATCSALRVENDAVVEAFLAAHPDFRLLPMGRRMGPRADEMGGDVLRLSPHQHGTDGFFAALLLRTTNSA
jgi:16S rRNA (cytosine967-C5)-methyltransferase